MLDRIRHLEIVRQVATKHEDGHEERGVEREDEALEGELLLEPACGIGAVPHLLHVARLTNLGIQLQQVGSVRDHKHGASPFRPPPHPSGSSSSQEPSAPKPDVRHAAECE
eukprot:scaffold57144_cov66-Phaeocystis_antarctica.AAC.3